MQEIQSVYVLLILIIAFPRELAHQAICNCSQLVCVGTSRSVGGPVVSAISVQQSRRGSPFQKGVGVGETKISGTRIRSARNCCISVAKVYSSRPSLSYSTRYPGVLFSLRGRVVVAFGHFTHIIYYNWYLVRGTWYLIYRYVMCFLFCFQVSCRELFDLGSRHRT